MGQSRVHRRTNHQAWPWAHTVIDKEQGQVWEAGLGEGEMRLEIRTGAAKRPEGVLLTLPSGWACALTL